MYPKLFWYSEDKIIILTEVCMYGMLSNVILKLVVNKGLLFMVNGIHFRFIAVDCEFIIIMKLQLIELFLSCFMKLPRTCFCFYELTLICYY